MLIHSVAKEEQSAIRELYDRYKVGFYFTACSILNDADLAKAATVEAFRRIICNAYKFDEALNAEYWFFDILYTLCVNYVVEKGYAYENKENAIPANIEAPTEMYIKLFSSLKLNDIAALTRKSRIEISKVMRVAFDEIEIKDAATKFCPEFFDCVVSNDKTMFEEISEKERALTNEGELKQKKVNYIKRGVIIAVAVAFVCVSIFGIYSLVNKNYGSDIDHDPLGEDILIQFDNKIACTQMNGYIYFCGSDNKLYRRELTSDKNELVNDDYPKELINDGEYIYYRNYNDGYMYRIDFEGKKKISLCDVPGTSMALYNNRLYFSATNGIYSIPSEGGKFDDAELVLDTSQDANLYCVDMEIDEKGNVFFAGGIGGGIHHVTEYNSEPSVEGIFNDEVYNICIDNGFLYFDCKDTTGKILLYSFDLEAYYSNKSDTRILPKVVSNSKGENIILSTGAFFVYNGNIYFTGENNNASVIYMLDKDKKQQELIGIPEGSSYNKNNLYISDIYVSNEIIYCYASDGKSKGDRVFYMYEINDGKQNTIIFES